MTAGKVVKESRGSVFSDLDLPDAQELQAKSALVFRIAKLINNLGLTQNQAAQLLSIDQPKISNLLRGRLQGFSTDRLFRFLNTLNQDIEIIVRPKPRAKRAAEIKVLAA